MAANISTATNLKFTFFYNLHSAVVQCSLSYTASKHLCLAFPLGLYDKLIHVHVHAQYTPYPHPGCVDQQYITMYMFDY